MATQQKTQATNPKQMDKIDQIIQYVAQINLKVRGEYTEEDLDNVQTKIQEQLNLAKHYYRQYITNSSSVEKNKTVHTQINDKFKSLKDLLDKSDSDQTDFNETYSSLFKHYNELEYSFQTAAQETNNLIGATEETEKKIHADMILLCKNVRIMEDIINKICTNNIDKSIIDGERQFDSIRYGFEWLFCREDLNIGGNPDKKKHLDIRDSNRYLDYIKYQIMVASKYCSNSYKTSEEIDVFFENIKSIYAETEYEDKQTEIKEFKKATKELIEVFFNIYECLVNYRNALFQEEAIRKSLGNKRNVKTDAERINLEIINLSSIAVRVLIDRFVSFVKINDLNFGNSTFKRAWFNYSELSNSNYSGSGFKYARIENARMKNCDISTCNLTLADGGNTDFSHSNFTYSNLCGINLAEAVLNYCELQNVSFTDSNINNYKSAITKTLKSLKLSATDRATKLNETWQKDYLLQESTLPQKFDNLVNTVKNLENLHANSISFEKSQSYQILDYDDEKAESMPHTILTSVKEIIEYCLSKYISAELLEYIRNKFNKQIPGSNFYKTRIKKYGKIYLDTANLTNASIKNAQLNGNNLNHIKMTAASFENSDLSGATMYYTSSDTTSFILANLNHTENFESNYYLANFSSAVINNAIFINCNLEHTNWDKAILISTIYADFSERLELFLDESTNTRPLTLMIKKYIGKNDAHDGSDIILDDPNYTKDLQTSEKNGNNTTNNAWQKNCHLDYASFIEALADRTMFINIIADRSTFNRSSMKSTFWFNCKTYLADFIETDMRYSMLAFCCMGQSNFTNANMTSMDIRYVDFSHCNLFSTLFNLTEMDHCLFANSNTRSMNLSGAAICNSAFENCKFEGTILSNTTFENCIFSNVDFIDLVGLHSSKFVNCFYENCSYKRGKRKPMAIENGIGNLLEKIYE